MVSITAAHVKTGMSNTCNSSNYYIIIAGMLTGILGQGFSLNNPDKSEVLLGQL